MDCRTDVMLVGMKTMLIPLHVFTGEVLGCSWVKTEKMVCVKTGT